MRISREAIVAFLLFGGLINGLASRFAESILEDGSEGALHLFGISPFELMVCGIAIHGILSSEGHIKPKALGWPALLFMIVTVFPTSLGSWFALGIYGFWVSLNSTGEARRSAILFSGLAVCATWWSVGERSIGGSLLRLDAEAAAGFYSLFHSGVERIGNVISNGNGHSIVILVGCSTFYGLPLSLLSMYALARWNGARGLKPLIKSGLGLSAVYAICNMLRLVYLSQSAEAYAAGHSATGLGLFDAFTTVLTIGFAWHAAKTPSSPSSNYARIHR